MIVRLPGVYPPQHDTSLLTAALSSEPLTKHTRVLDLCSGTGALSIAAKMAGAQRVVAVDISRLARFNAWINGLINRVPVDTRRGDLTDAVKGEWFDLVVSNPPYVPALTDELPISGIERAWDAGKDGRALLDRITSSAPEVLAPGGTLLLLQSAMCGVEKTEAILEEHGMTVEISARRFVPFGPVMRSRRTALEARGLITAGQETEELVVIRATKSPPQ